MEQTIRFKSKQNFNGDLFDKLPKKEKKQFENSLQKFKKQELDFKKTMEKINKTKHDLLRHASKEQLNVNTLKLPKTYDKICQNEDLCKILLKKPDIMSEEERNFIGSFNKAEKELFLEFLKKQAQELGWQGNGLGSGSYYENAIKFYRNKDRVLF